MSGQNLGEVLLKDWRDGRASLTPKQAAYVEEWEHERVVRLGALGLTCMGIPNPVAADGQVHSHGTVGPAEAMWHTRCIILNWTS